MREAFPSAAAYVAYGPTEAAVLASAHRVPADGAVEGHRIGTALGNVRLYVCDALGNAQPTGVPGELRIGGAGVARGYGGRAALTAERFIPDAFGREPGARLYRSGDRVRWRAEGVLEFLGRVDQQVKVRGFRIEPGEVEAALERHPAVREAVVAVREDGGERRLVGYVVAAEGEAVDGAELRAWLKGRLPEYMVPAAVVALETLPLTPTGKVDRRALPAPDASAGGAYVAPRGEVEERLAAIWAEVLKLERVGAHDDFFALGGHSLLATRVTSRIAEELGTELPLRALFETPTVAGLAARLSAELGSADDVESDALAADGSHAGSGEARSRLRGMLAERADRRKQREEIRPVARDRPLPLSFAQQRLWLIDRMEPGSAAYNMPAGLRLRGALDVAVLERTLGEVVRRHESLRTVFGVEAGEPVQTVLPAAPVRLPVVDLGGLPAEDRERTLRRLAAGEAGRPFDLGRGPLLRSVAARLAPEEHAVLFTMHHIVSDGWSMGVLVGEVSRLYAALSRGEESPLAPLPLQYPDYAVWQRGRLAGEVLDAQLAFWRGRLAG
ncbi:MAG TPA: condensation domain-containing protein, partial [Longimicrobiaceae bacterium]|nr:condensation domain-containing protein [Longimicrobiaceae bacterium]